MRAASVSAALLAAVATAATLHAQAAPAKVAPAKGALHWGPAPAVFPAGAQMAVVRGDPAKAAPFTVELSMPDGYRIPPHWHPTDEHVVVQSGTFMVGMGDSLDLAKTRTLRPGQKGEVPAKMHHYAAAKGATVISVSAMGPFAMTYVHPADDPQRKPVAR